MIDIEAPKERALLIGAPRKGSVEARHVDEHLEELERLTDTAGAEVLRTLIQLVDPPSPSHYLGQGKVAELARVMESCGATLVIFDEELSPVQGKNLEQALKVRVMDRAELILDIFATRARTKEARMQVELAQLEYLLPRLQRMWVHLSRIRGGIGLRGPGETQLETDRRLIRRRISHLKRKLSHVTDHREILRKKRSHVFTGAIVGYTNAGKSSVIAALTGARPLVEDRLFATLDTLKRETDIGLGQRLRLVDTVGFIRKLPHHLVASFRATLEEVRRADVLLHVIDAADDYWRDHVGVVEAVVGEPELNGRVIPVFNKMDLIAEPQTFKLLARERFPRAVFVSARKKELSELTDLLQRMIPRARWARDASGLS